ncbi:MAG: hypothetical protein AAB607_01150 [Patescibacteria group bacterium]
MINPGRGFLIEKMNKYANKYKYLPIMLVFITANFQPVSPADIGVNANKPDIYSYSDALIAQNNILTPNAVKTKKDKQKVMNIWITAYSSTPEQTDSTPFITASGNYVRIGVAAANFLPFGSRFKLPELFDDKVFVVEDRMHERFNNRIDIWFSTKEEAKNFGKRLAKVEIL